MSYVQHVDGVKQSLNIETKKQRNKHAEKRSKQSQQAYITKSKVASEDLHYCPSRCTQQASTSPNNQSPNNHSKLLLHQTITASFYFTKPEKSEPVPNKSLFS